jgi:hypothetical protein
MKTQLIPMYYTVDILTKRLRLMIVIYFLNANNANVTDPKLKIETWTSL